MRGVSPCGCRATRRSAIADQPEMRENCPGLVAANRPPITPAALKLAALNADQVRLTFIGHATFLIESPQLVRIATDYNDYREAAGPARHRHDEPCARHALHRPSRPGDQIRAARLGPSPDKPAIWDLKYRDVRVRNVPTNIRNFGGGTERYGNSIFIFEIANMCIAHLGHLHHTLTQQQLNEIGRVDVVMAPVDGNYTLDLDGMMEVLDRAQGAADHPDAFFRLVHAGPFLERASQQWPVERAEIPSVVVSKTTLPASPKVLVLPGF